MICLKPVRHTGLTFNHIIATGGIGSGIFFSMSDNRTLGRNESRMATLLPYKDFCKQHIIMHYIAILMGAKINGEFQSFPIGQVGNDDIGKNLIEMMKAVGMDVKTVSICNDSSTLFSVCFQYPDNTGGNITTENSASSRVSTGDISSFFHEFKLSGDHEIILAVPEVPLQTRIKLLEYGTQRGSLNIASILSSEVDDFDNMYGFEMANILSINIDEALSIAQMPDESVESNAVIEACINKLKNINPDISVIITDGPNGSYCYTNNHLEFTPVLDVPVISTAGAGDAYLAGTIAGLCCGLPLCRGVRGSDLSSSGFQSAVELGTLLASLSVGSPDTIHPTANAELLYQFAIKNKVAFGEDFFQLFADCIP
jgi:sugar/nucleoside kinase (ribokinase family)